MSVKSTPSWRHNQRSQDKTKVGNLRREKKPQKPKLPTNWLLNLDETPQRPRSVGRDQNSTTEEPTVLPKTDDALLAIAPTLDTALRKVDGADVTQLPEHPGRLDTMERRLPPLTGVKGITPS
jgi:hypothetical protein